MMPRDGQHVSWPALVGRNRARYPLLTGKNLSAQEASHGALSTRCCRRTGCSTARGSLLASWPSARRASSVIARMLSTQDLERAFLERSQGLAREAYAQRSSSRSAVE